jgi:hypothetical protein
MAKPRISYVSLDRMDARMQAEMDRCRREGTPRPESSAVRAHVPACFWFFAESWHNIFRTGVLDHALKELCRLYVSLRQSALDKSRQKRRLDRGSGA